MSLINDPSVRSGAIDGAVEAWSYTFDLTLIDGRKVSAFLSFTRYSGLRPIETTTKQDQNQNDVEYHLTHSHVVNFAFSVPPSPSPHPVTSLDSSNSSPVRWYSKPSPPSPPQGTYFLTSALDAPHLDFLRASVEGEERMDPFIRESMLGILREGKVLKPDTMIGEGEVSVKEKDGEEWHELRYGAFGISIREVLENGKEVYKVVANADDGKYGFDLEVVPPTTAPEATFSYEMKGDPGHGALCTHTVSFTPRCTVSGMVRLDDPTTSIAVDSSSSSAWYTHSTGGAIPKWDARTAQTTESSSTTAELQLTNGWSVKLHTIFDEGLYDDSTTLRDSKAVVITPKFEALLLGKDDFEFETLESWTSLSTLNEYGTRWTLTIPKLELELEIQAIFEQQEFESLTAGRGYWKGAVNVSGTMGEKKESLEGLGFIESRPTQLITRFDQYLKRAARLTTLEVSKLYPDKLCDPEHAMKALGFHSSDSTAPDWSSTVPTNPSLGTPHPLRFTSDISLSTLHATLFEPIRHLITSAGKSWRSYLAMVCISAFGASPEPYRPLFAAIELVHTGSLIIDDIQDDSPIRRGVPAVHTMWGVPAAINAGEAAYFMFEIAVRMIPSLSIEKRLGLFEIFFETMRFSHAGQALDIAGQPKEILDGVLRGEIEPARLERAIISAHRLKTAMVAMNIAKMSALLADASEVQMSALSRHWEQTGIAFQIVDDVYDIRRGPTEGKAASAQGGVKKANAILKRRGDDIRSGKISIPIAKAGMMMPLGEAKWVWETVLSKPGDDDVLTQKVIDKLEEYRVVDRCVEEANKMVEESWPSVEGHLVDCQAKVYLNALCRYMGKYHSI